MSTVEVCKVHDYAHCWKCSQDRVFNLERQLSEARGKLGAVQKWIGGCSCKHCPEIRRILSKEGNDES